MKVGDLVKIYNAKDGSSVGYGLFLGHGRGMNIVDYYFLFSNHEGWQSRITTFDKPYWDFEVISESRRPGKI
mgnify:CR=1 FL=1